MEVDGSCQAGSQGAPGCCIGEKGLGVGERGQGGEPPVDGQSESIIVSGLSKTPPSKTYKQMANTLQAIVNHLHGLLFELKCLLKRTDFINISI